MHKCVKMTNVEVVAKWLFIVLAVNEIRSQQTKHTFHFIVSRARKMTTVEFGGGPTIEARRRFANVKEGSHIPK